MARRSVSPYERFGEARPVEDVLLVEHTVVDGETMSSIAHKYYEDWRLWHVIADRNKIYDPRLLVPGTRFVIPSRTLERGTLESG